MATQTSPLTIRETSQSQRSACQDFVEGLAVAALVTERGEETVIAENFACRALFSGCEPRTHSASVQRAVLDFVGGRAAVLLAPGLPQPPVQLRLADGRALRWTAVALPFQPNLHLHCFAIEGSPTAAIPAEQLGEELYRLTFEKAAVGIAVVSSSSRFLAANPAFCAMADRSAADLLQCRVTEVMLGSDASVEEEWESHLAGSDDAFRADRRLIRPDSEELWVGLSVSVSRDSRGRPACYVLLAEDLTQSKRDREELERHLVYRAGGHEEVQVWRGST